MVATILQLFTECFIIILGTWPQYRSPFFSHRLVLCLDVNTIWYFFGIISTILLPPSYVSYFRDQFLPTGPIPKRLPPEHHWVKNTLRSGTIWRRSLPWMTPVFLILKQGDKWSLWQSYQIPISWDLGSIHKYRCILFGNNLQHSPHIPFSNWDSSSFTLFLHFSY